MMLRSRLSPPLELRALEAEPAHSHTGLTKRVCRPRPGMESEEGSEKAGGGLGRCVMVPYVLQDVHLVHGLDLLLFL